MSAKVYNVLFICTGNSARSILAEAIMNQLGGGHFKAYSAGSDPKGQVHPFALETLRDRNFDVTTLRSKSWDEFATAEAPTMDFIFTVCDNAAGEVCPLWPGQPVTAHWGFPDPAAAEGSADIQKAAFAKTFKELVQRLRIFLNLPFDKIDHMALQQQLKKLGEQE